MDKVVTNCFVIFIDDGVSVRVQSVIYLYRPDPGLGESLLHFDNVFEAKKYIRANSLKDWPIQIAS